MWNHINKNPPSFLGPCPLLPLLRGRPAAESNGSTPCLLPLPLALPSPPPCLQVLYENGFLYDSTVLECPDCGTSDGMSARVWPYTLQDGVAQVWPASWQGAGQQAPSTGKKGRGDGACLLTGRRAPTSGVSAGGSAGAGTGIPPAVGPRWMPQLAT